VAQTSRSARRVPRAPQGRADLEVRATLRLTFAGSLTHSLRYDLQGERGMNSEQAPPRWTVRFGQVLAARLEARGLDARDWLWFHPREEEIDSKDASVFEQFDLHRNAERWERHFSAQARGAIPDFSVDVLPALRRRFVLLLVGGLGSHMVPAHVLEEALSLNAEETWVHHVDYGNTLSSNADCAARAAESCREILRGAEAEGKQLLFLGHSKGANIILELMTEPAYADLKEQTWGALAVAGAIGGSPACDSLLGRAVSRAGSAPAFLREGLRRLGRLISGRFEHPLLAGLPSLEELPDGVRDLSRKRRHELLSHVRLPEDVRFFSIAGAIERERAKPDRFLSRDLDKTFLYLATYELARHSALNDTQLLLSDAKWPPGPNVFHLGTIHADHWGLAYGQVLPGVKPDPTPREAILEAALSVVLEMA
jgi:hypothetical protein